MKQWSCVPSLQRSFDSKTSSDCHSFSSLFSVSLLERTACVHCFYFLISYPLLHPTCNHGLCPFYSAKPLFAEVTYDFSFLNIIFILWTHVLVWHYWFVSPWNCLNIFLDLFLHLAFLLQSAFFFHSFPKVGCSPGYYSWLLSVSLCLFSLKVYSPLWASNYHQSTALSWDPEPQFLLMMSFSVRKTLQSLTCLNWAHLVFPDHSYAFSCTVCFNNYFKHPFPSYPTQKTRVSGLLLHFIPKVCHSTLFNILLYDFYLLLSSGLCHLLLALLQQVPKSVSFPSHQSSTWLF